MATRTSSQSGNFNSTSTWGGSAVPVDGDDFVVSAGHIVTINDDRRVTNGYHDSYVRGKLLITGSGKLRMNGNLLVQSSATEPSGGYFAEGNSDTGPFYQMQAGAVLEIKGTTADNHRLRIGTQYRNTCEIEGTCPWAKTYITSATAVNDASFPVPNATVAGKFEPGDWICVFVEAEDIDNYELQNALYEGFIVHDVDDDDIYVRRFVSPTSNITRASGSNIYVEDPNVFRVGQKIIFGTGANRNVKTISSIRKGRNKITLDSAISGSVVGETVYYTGIEKYHRSGDTLQKLATPITAGGTEGTRTIQVASTDGFVVGQRLLIEANDPADRGWDYNMEYEIESISGNSVVLTENFANERKVGAWVTILDRDTVIKSTDIGNNAERPYFEVQYVTASGAYGRRVRIRNCLFEGLGGQNNTYQYGVSFTGRMSFENNTYGEYASCYEGNVFANSNHMSNSGTYTRDAHHLRWFNNVSYNSYRNFFRHSSGSNHKIHGWICWRNNDRSLYADGLWGEHSDVSYNHCSRSENYGISIIHAQIATISYNYSTHMQERAFYTVYNQNGVHGYYNYFDYYRYWPYTHPRGNDFIHVNSWLGNSLDDTLSTSDQFYTGVQVSGDGQARWRRGGGNTAKGISMNHNFVEGDTVEWFNGYCWRQWVSAERAYFVRRTGNTSNDAGFVESVFVPQGATVYVSCEVKLSSNYNGSKPFLGVRKQGPYKDGAYVLDGVDSVKSNTDTGVGKSNYAGFRHTTQYGTASETGYQKLTHTIAPKDYDYFIQYAVYQSSTNAAGNGEGWYQRPFEVNLTEKYSGVASTDLTNINSKVGVGSSAATRRTRIGGRLK